MDAAKKLGTTDTTQEGAKRTRILLVDEHTLTGEIELKHLAGAGFDVVLASDSEQAISRVSSEAFDVIMIDSSFRGDQGPDTLKVLKAKSKNPNIKSIVSGLSFPPPLKRKVREAGADEIFVKPVPRPQLLREIKKLTANEIRVNERIPHSLNLVLSWEKGSYNCRTLDLSSEGVHLSELSSGTVRKPPVGAEVEMDIQLTGSESVSKVQGEVRRHTTEGFGVRFLKLKKSDQKKIDKYVLKHSLEQASSHFYL
jgi:CheY-like chemotaxis protein